MADDWWDRLYDEERPAPAKTTPWWNTRAARPAEAEPAPPQPAFQFTVTPTAPAADRASARRARYRWWFLRRGSAAGVGYLLGLGPVIQGRIHESGNGAVGFAFLLWIVAWLLATKALNLVPARATEEAHLAADWLAHIPSATVLAALALNTPGVLQ
ncbi:hypothetical protein ABT160_02610 [Streptomyces sp. NPDC001941]|uniref:hypothetical protein n=1 Tax=Streptomyces sp. NPDC001941 TaxID=3154659 RepID=UPI00333114DC